MKLANKKVVIVGLGRSALGAAALLRDRGADVFISDAGNATTLASWAQKADALGVGFETGTHSTGRFAEADLVVMSPGVPPSIPPVAEARARQVPVIAELELGARFCTAPILAVTGTNGKTTMTELLAAMARATGRRTVLAGNNKTPFSLAMLETPAADCVVLEVSSYQLETIDTLRPAVGAVLNLTPDHLGRHGSMAGYAAAKARLLMNQQAGDTAVLNADDAVVAGLPVPDGVTTNYFSMHTPQDAGVWTDGASVFEGTSAVAPVSDCPLPGRHNLANALAALAAGRAAGFEMTHCLAALRSFEGVEHRIELVGTIDGVRYYNDSKSTNIDSLRVALESFTDPVVLIAGGQGKGAAYDGLRDCVAAHVKQLITLGEEAPKLVAAFGSVVPTLRGDTMAAAVDAAHDAASDGDVVLLSPGCASFDMYRDFEERGSDFKAAVRRCSERVALQAGESA